jgi:hypothetical protein
MRLASVALSVAWIENEGWKQGNGKRLSAEKQANPIPDIPPE